MAYTGETDQQEIWSLFNIAWDFAEEGYLPTLRRVVEHVAGWFHATGASLLLRHDPEGVYKLACSTGPENLNTVEVIVKPGEGIAGACIELGRPLLIHDPVKHPSLRKRTVGKRTELETAMVLPLVTPVSGCIGVLSLSRGLGADHFHEGDLHQAESVARYIALAVENIRLFTKATQATHEAMATHAKLQEIIQCLGVAVLVVDENEKLTDSNPEALRLLHRESSDVLVPKIWDGLHRALEGETIRERLHDPRSERSWSLVCTPIKGGGATATIEEVTAHEKALTDLNRMRRLAEIGQMSAAIAHDIRNPLTGIRSAAQLVQHIPETAELGQIIEEETLKLNSLCDDFLDFARPVALRISEVDLAGMAMGLKSGHSAEFRAAQVALTVQIQGKPPKIHGDALRIEQVMRNLLLNGLQACEPGDAVRLVVTPDGFQIADTGCGMDEDTVQNLFVPFFTTKPKGTGLGLSTVRKVIEAHGGEVRVRSTLGEGTVFEVSLPEA